MFTEKEFQDFFEEMQAGLKLAISKGRSKAFIARETGLSRATISRIAANKQINCTRETVRAINRSLERLEQGDTKMKREIERLRKNAEELKKQRDDFKSKLKKAKELIRFLKKNPKKGRAVNGRD